MTRQPPLPPGLPPKPAVRPRSFSSSSYRAPNDGPRYHEDNYPSQRDDHSHRPKEAPPPRYEFRGAYDTRSSYPRDIRRSPPRYDYAPGTGPPRNDGSYSGTHSSTHADTYRPRDNSRDEEFTFRHEAPPTIDFRQPTNYPSRSPPRQRGYAQDNHNQFRPINRGDGQRGGRGGYRGRGGPRLASEREFLKGNRAPTPDLMLGMDEDDGQGIRYKPAEDVSDSEEIELEFSDDGDVEQPKKKQARTDAKAVDGDSVPRWSNPDPYTALPPPDESQRKKRDVVKLIRKSRVTASSDNITKTEAVTDDFISFDFGNDEEDGNFKPVESTKTVFSGAPTGPRFTQYENRRPEEQYRQDSQSKVHYWEEPRKVEMKAAPALPQKQEIQASQSTAPRKAKLTTDMTPDYSLGSRKRNIRDEIKDAPRIHEKGQGKKPVANGGVLQQWRPLSNSNSTPWVEIDHSDTANMGVWLHKEIVDFHNYVRPRDFEQITRAKLVEDLNARVQKTYSDAEIRTFGSFPAGLYLPTADMDLVMVSRTFMNGGNGHYGKKNALWNFRNFLLVEKLPLDESIEVITKAKVPLVKYVDRLTGLKVDISFENDTGLIANKTFQDWKVEFPAMPILVTLIKHLLAMRGLNEPVNGGIGGFSCICLVVSLLQHMAQVQSRTMIAEHHLGEVLMEFLDLYGNEFDTKTTAIQLKPPGYINKVHANVPYKKGPGANKFCIIDPNNSANDISGGAKNTATIRKCFSDAYTSLQARMGTLQHSVNRRHQSILGCILAGNYSSFELQRQHLAHIHEKLYGPIEIS